MNENLIETGMELERITQMKKCLPNAFNLKDKTCFYIGANSLRFHYFNLLKNNGFKIDIIEIDYDNYIWLTEFKKSQICINDIVFGDASKFIPAKNYGLVFWAQSITQLRGIDIIESTIKKLENIYTELIMFHIPWGNTGVSGCFTPMYIWDFEKLGYKTNTIRKQCEMDSNLIAWKWKNEIQK